MAAEYVLKYGPMQAATISGGPAAIWGEIPFTALGWTDSLNQAGSWSATMPLDCGIKQWDLAPGSSCCWIMRDDQCVFSGPMWTASVDVAAGTVTLNGEGWLSYLARRYDYDVAFPPDPIEKTWGGKQLFPGAIVTNQALVDAGYHMAVAVLYGRTGYDQGWGFGGTRSGPPFYVPDEWNYPSFGPDPWPSVDFAQTDGAILSLADILQKCANTAGVPGFKFTGTASGAGMAIRYDMLTPVEGRHIGESLTIDRGLAALTVAIDGSQRVNTVISIGDPVRSPIVGYHTTAALAQTEPILNRVDSNSQMYLPATMLGRATEILDVLGQPLDLPSFTLTLDDPLNGDLQVGDVVGVQAQLGYLDIDDDYRITQMTTTVAGSETVTVTVAPAGTFT